MVGTEPLSVEIADSQGEIENHAGGRTRKTSSYLLSSVFADGAEDADKREDEEEDRGHDHGSRKRRAHTFASSEADDNTQSACLFTAQSSSLTLASDVVSGSAISLPDP